MPITSIINGDALLAVVRARVEADLTAAAEPIIQAALQQVETTLRAQVAQMVLTYLETGYDVTRLSDRLVISVQLGSRG